MEFEIENFPSLLPYLPQDAIKIEGEDALHLYEMHWLEIKDNIKGTDEDILLQDIIQNFGSGVFVPF